MERSLIYLPGFNSGPQSEKSRRLKRRFPHLTVASYDTWDPDRGQQELDALITAAQTAGAGKLTLIGSSLGGYWAYHFAVRYGLRCVLLNPCMTPEATLAPYVGEVEHMYSGRKGMLKLEHLQRYAAHRIEGRPICTVLHEKGDELIPYQESIENFSGRARLVLIEGGSHRFDHLELAITEIEALIGLHQARIRNAPAA